MKDNLRVLYGEFLVLPAPLEMSGTWCSHSCPYCFANLAKTDRQFDVRGTMALINNMGKRKGLDAQLLRLKYPVNISNHVDPFSESNHKNHVPVIKLLTELGVPIYFQTRGGNEGAIADVLDVIPQSVFYVSITHGSDESRQWIEPNAPSIESRLALIDELISRGHHVVVGLNPLVPEWMPDPEPMLLTLKDKGVWGVWIETLHLNYKQRDGMRAWQRKRMGEDLIKTAMKHAGDARHHQHFLKTRYLAEQIGLQVYTAGQPNVSYFFEVFHQAYPRTFPVMQDFVNHCHLNNIQRVTWKEWYGFFGDRLPKIGKTNEHIDYIRQTTFLELSKHFDNLTRKTKFSYPSVLQVAYKYPQLRKLPFSPWSQAAFNPVTDDDGQFVLDDEGMAVFEVG